MAKLPVSRTVGDTYKFVFTHPLLMLRCLWVLLLVWVAASIIVAVIPVNVNLATNFGIKSLIFLSLIFLIGFVVLMALWVSALVAVHRAVLFGESSWSACLRFGDRQWNFIGRGILIGLIGAGIGLATFLIFLVLGPLFTLIGMAVRNGGTGMNGVNWPVVISFVAVFIIWLFIAVFVNRFMLTFPATAADDKNSGLGSALDRTKGNGWRFFFGAFLCAVPIQILSAIDQKVFAPDLSPAVHTPILQLSLAGNVLMGALDMLQIAISVTFLVFSYRHLTQNNVSAEAS